jgi:hypothetical protein
MKKHFLITLLLLPIIAISACSNNPESPGDYQLGQEVSVAEGSYTDVSVEELQTMLEDKDFIFVNVYIPFEGDIPETDISIPFDQIAQNLEQLPANKDTKLCFIVGAGA